MVGKIRPPDSQNFLTGMCGKIEVMSDLRKAKLRPAKWIFIFGFAIGFLLIAGGAVLALISQPQPTEEPSASLPRAELQIGQDEPIAVEIARTPEARVQGLSGRAGLPPNTGMLFVYEEADRYGFWMKDMNFALDMVWIADGEVVAITENVQPESYPKSFYPPKPVTMMLEVEAGTAAERGWETGDRVKL